MRKYLSCVAQNVGRPRLNNIEPGADAWGSVFYRLLTCAALQPAHQRA